MDLCCIGSLQAPAVCVKCYNVETFGVGFQTKLHHGAQSRLHTTCGTIGGTGKIICNNEHLHGRPLHAGSVERCGVQ